MSGRIIDKIIIHCSASLFGDCAEINRWHLERGWAGIGYHFVITNGIRESRDHYNASFDGIIEPGRDLWVQGAHCLGENKNSIGICLIGVRFFTGKQLYLALPQILHFLMVEYRLGPDQIFGHKEFNAKKTCPNFDVGYIRKLLAKGER